MADLKLSDLKEDEVQLADEQPKSLKLSDLKPEDIQRADSSQPYEHFGSDILEAGKDILHGIGYLADLPVAPIRSLITGEGIKGPSTAPTAQQVLEKIPALKETKVPVFTDLRNLANATPEQIAQYMPQIKTEQKPLSEVAAPLLDIGLGIGAAKGMGLAAKGVGAGIEGAESLLKSSARKGIEKLSPVLPESFTGAYQKALKEGIDVTAPEFAETLAKEHEAIASEVADPILQKIATRKAEHQAAMQNVDDQMIKINDRMDQVKKLDKLSQIAESKQDALIVGQRINDTAIELQKDIYNTRKSLGKQYDKLDKAAEATGVVPDVRNAVSKFEELLLNNRIEPKSIKSYNDALKLYQQEPSIETYRALKKVFADAFESNDYLVSGPAKKAFGVLKNDYTSALNNAGHLDLANDIESTNSKWSALLKTEDEIAGTLPEKIGEQYKFYPEAKTRAALENLPLKGEKKSGEAERLMDLLDVLNPEFRQKYVPKMEELVSQKEAIKGFKPEEVQAIPPDLTRLEKIMSELKGQTPEKIPGLDLAGKTPEAIEKEIRSLLPKYETQSGAIEADIKLRQIFDFLKSPESKLSTEQVAQLEQKTRKLAQDLKLQSQVRGVPEFGVEPEAALKGGSLKAVGKLATSAKAGVKLGQALRTESQVIQEGSVALSKSSPQELLAFSQKMVQTDPAAAPYAKILAEAADKNKISKDAYIYGLMQQAKFRELYKKTEGIEDETSGK